MDLSLLDRLSTARVLVVGDVMLDEFLCPVSARYVRITVTDPGPDSTARISEVEIFGRKAWKSN